MTTVYDVPVSRVIPELAKSLKKQEAVKALDWAVFVKTGGSRERGPEDADWWYVRSASILRKLQIHGPLGVHALQGIYGGKKNRGYKPEKKRRGSGAVIRNILHQLEKSGLVEKTKRGRVVTPKGRSLLDKISHQIAGKG